MAYIFISYASEDRDRVKPLAKALEDQSWSVWWDREIIVGQSFEEVIEQALDEALSVVDEAATKFEEINKKLKGEKHE